MRLDKLLANKGLGSRKDVKALIKKKQITVNNKIVKDSGTKVNLEMDTVRVNDCVIRYREYVYIMLNKPPGYISATTDNHDKTVIDLLPENYQRFNPFPVGRLDKDTEGLLLITNDGDLNHQLTSPKKDVNKTYFAHVSGRVTEADVQTFQNGVQLDGDFTAKPAELEILESNDVSFVNVTVTEGKFHQVKRMFKAVGKKVIYLKRIQMGSLKLAEELKTGEFRELTESELNELKPQKKG